MTNAYHKWHGNCEVISADGKYTIIRFFDGTHTHVKRVQTRMMSEYQPVILRVCRCAEKIKKYGKCLHYHIQSLRKWATEIDGLKNDIGNCLGETNKANWDGMNSQKKKIAVFRAMELGFITWQIGSKNYKQISL